MGSAIVEKFAMKELWYPKSPNSILAEFASCGSGILSTVLILFGDSLTPAEVIA